jgi:hypothetical protein
MKRWVLTIDKGVKYEDFPPETDAELTRWMMARIGLGDILKFSNFKIQEGGTGQALATDVYGFYGALQAATSELREQNHANARPTKCCS